MLQFCSYVYIHKFKWSALKTGCHSCASILKLLVGCVIRQKTWTSIKSTYHQYSAFYDSNRSYWNILIMADHVSLGNKSERNIIYIFIKTIWIPWNIECYYTTGMDTNWHQYSNVCSQPHSLVHSIYIWHLLPHLAHFSFLQMETVDSSKTMGPLYWATWHHIPEDCSLNICCHENLKFDQVQLIIWTFA